MDVCQGDWYDLGLHCVATLRRYVTTTTDEELNML